MIFVKFADYTHIYTNALYMTHSNEIEEKKETETSNIFYAPAPINMHYIIELNEDIIYH